MNVVLLSGGSGKRLWPLSNDIKSKQFIRFFKKEDGSYESMLERVYHQIKSTDSSSQITIATSSLQVPLIKEQLGENVSVSIEPARRDTFPAIALASVFLNEKLNIDENEAVIVCPVDPYVDDSYYSSFKELETIVREGKSGITLMGIGPTYPSEKYGYIIPAENDRIAKVRSFKEKPDEEKAKEYIKEGALWNAGVFAFKLGYLLDIAHKYIDFTSYDDLYEKYPALNKISFDYAVVEKEKDITVLRYDGRWEDVGTWNTLSDVLDDKTIGDVVVDDSSNNTTVINSLGIPLLSMGCHDMIIVASEDGILVSDKAKSSAIKSYVDKLPDNKNSLSLIRQDDSSSIYTLKLLKGENFSFFLKSGEMIINTVKGAGSLDNYSLKAGESYKVNKGKCSIIAQTDFEAVLVVLGDILFVEGKDAE